MRWIREGRWRGDRRHYHGAAEARASAGAEDHGAVDPPELEATGRGALCRGCGVAGARAEAGTRMGATEAGAPRAADSPDIGMGGSSMGVPPGQMRVRSRGSRWRMRPLLEKESFGPHTLLLSVTQTIECLVFRLGLLETV